MANVKEAKLKDLIQDDRNLNAGTERGQQLIEKSLREFGAGRSILLDKNNRIIAGNKTHKNAELAGLDDVIIVETDGTKLVAVKRTDVDLDTKKGRKMALADNATVKADLAWNTEELESVSNDYDIDLDEWDAALASDEENPYTMKVESPLYEEKGEQPEVSELYDAEKAQSLIASIEESSADEELKSFLRAAAMRHVVFDYGRIAEYYCHASKEVQQLMEDSALVVIDYDKAVEDGYVRLKSELRETMMEDVFNDAQE